MAQTVTSFSALFTAINQDVNKIKNSVVKNIYRELTTFDAKHDPSGTPVLTGAARFSWKAGPNVTDYQPMYSPDRTYPIPFQPGDNIFPLNWTEFHIYNNQPWVAELNDGLYLNFVQEALAIGLSKTRAQYA